MVEVVFIGTGEATDPELPNTSTLLRGSRAVLVDCGYSVPPAFWRHFRDAELLDAVYLTHLHADHSFGLPALLLWMRFAGRRRPLQIIGGPGTRDWAERLLDLGYSGAFASTKCFPIEWRELSPGEPYALGSMQLRCAQSAHSMVNYSLRVDDGQYAVACSGDGAPTAATATLYRGVHLLIHEAFRLEDAVDGHSTAVEVLELAQRVGARELALVHCAAGERGQLQSWLEARCAVGRTIVPMPGDVWRPCPL